MKQLLSIVALATCLAVPALAQTAVPLQNLPVPSGPLTGAELMLITQPINGLWFPAKLPLSSFFTNPTIAGLTVTGSLTATGLVTNADLVNSATTVNGQVCTLGLTCTVTTSATAIAPGTTTVSPSVTNGVIYSDSGGILRQSLSPPGAYTWPALQSFSTTTLGPLASAVNSATFGAYPGFSGGPYVWNTAPIRMGAELSLGDPTLFGETNEFLAVIGEKTDAIPVYTLTTSAPTASGNTLTFSSVPATIKPGMLVGDVTAPTSVILASVQSTTATTVVLAAPVTGPVGAGDTIQIGSNFFKGPLFLDAENYSSSGTNQILARSNNGLTIFSTNQVSNGFSEGVVVVAGDAPGFTGSAVAGEFDLTTPSSDTPGRNYCDSVGSYCRVNLFVGNYGPNTATAMFETTGTANQWNDGFLLRGIVTGHNALEVPWQTYINFCTATDSPSTHCTTDVTLGYVDSSSNLQIGIGATAVKVPVTLAATAFKDYATGGTMLLNSGGANFYTDLVDGSGRAAFTAGGTSDPNNYLDNTQTLFRSRDILTTFALINSNGLAIFNAAAGYDLLAPAAGGGTAAILTLPAVTGTLALQSAVSKTCGATIVVTNGIVTSC